jgi:ABC-type branched-subunit amino acid transport system substrate-binding protein
VLPGRKKSIAAKIIAGTASLLMLAAGSALGAGSAGGATRASHGDKTITIGVLTDVTGLASSGNKETVGGVEAGVVYAKTQGYTIHYVVGDTTSSPAGALTAAQKLVEQDHVIAVIAVSSVAFGAAPYLNQQHVPVIGLQEDGPEWTTDLNMFSVGGIIRTNLVSTIYGKFFKMEGVTTVGTLGYGISPSSSEYSKGAADSAKHAGLKEGYVNGNFAFGSTNVAPEALAMKSAGVNGVYAAIDPNTALALVAALRQDGVTPKVALFPTGYGADLEQAGPNASQIAQGVYFTIGPEPVEMHTPATELLQKSLRAAGLSEEPAEATYNGWGSIGLLLQGLKGAGSNPTQSSLLSALSKVHKWTYLGLWGGKSLNINNRSDTANADGPGNCTYMVKYVGKAFKLVSGADPICGPTIPGLNETPG